MDDDENICKYCLISEPAHQLITPCNCVTKVHTSCLNTWVNDRHIDNCEICKEVFQYKSEYQIAIWSHQSVEIKLIACVCVSSAISFGCFVIGSVALSQLYYTKSTFLTVILIGVFLIFIFPIILLFGLDVIVIRNVKHIQGLNTTSTIIAIDP